MRHVLIINPPAARRSSTAGLLEQAEDLRRRHGLAVECILTRSPGHAEETCRAIAGQGEPVRFYACGGDGTMNRVLNGILGFPHAAMTCVPTGTANDFLKNFGEEALPRFLDLEQLWDGPERPLDVMECGGRAALTIACAGLDARVARDVHTYGRTLHGKASYIASLAVNFALRPLSQSWEVWVDGQKLPWERYVLAAVCNGRYYGGGFLPVPEARLDDGCLRALLVRKVSRVTFLRLVGAYAKGEYRRFPYAARCCPGREVRIRAAAGEEIVACLDGEAIHEPEITVRLSGSRVPFFFPRGCDPNATARENPEGL